MMKFAQGIWTLHLNFLWNLFWICVFGHKKIQKCDCIFISGAFETQFIFVFNSLKLNPIWLNFWELFIWAHIKSNLKHCPYVKLPFEKGIHEKCYKNVLKIEIVVMPPWSRIASKVRAKRSLIQVLKGKNLTFIGKSFIFWGLSQSLSKILKNDAQQHMSTYIYCIYSYEWYAMEIIWKLKLSPFNKNREIPL